MATFPVTLKNADGQTRRAYDVTSLRKFEFDGFLVQGEAPEPFDPSEHTVDEVEKHLSTATPTERQRVLGAEKSGKGRSTLVAGSVQST